MPQEQLEHYLLLLSDSFFANLAVDTSTEMIMHSMQVFGKYNSGLMIFFSTVGFTGALMLNYLLGTVIYKIVAPSQGERQEKSVSRIEKLRSSKLLPFILLFSAHPIFGKFIILFAGFCRIRFAYVFAICILAKLTYYIYSLLL